MTDNGTTTVARLPIQILLDLPTFLTSLIIFKHCNLLRLVHFTEKLCCFSYNNKNMTKQQNVTTCNLWNAKI